MATTEPSSAAEVVGEYFDALTAQDLDRAVAQWEPGRIDNLHGFGELVAPEGIRDYFTALFAAVPDWQFEVLETVAQADRVAVRWRARGTFNGTSSFEGFAPNGRSLELEGCDLLTVGEGKIIANHAYTNGMEFARQIGALPPAGSAAEKAMAAAFNAKTSLANRLRR